MLHYILCLGVLRSSFLAKSIDETVIAAENQLVRFPIFLMFDVVLRLL